MMTETFLFPSPSRRRGVRLVEVLRNGLQRRRDRRELAKSLSDLDGLDDRLLRDIGLTRDALEHMHASGER